ncbi:MAG TPA: ABC transporter permease subunit [Phycisphaerales bacterium]|nr:ABC transporter permease subunit [Phycisphaerales bacterium]
MFNAATLAIARTTFTEAVRQPVVLALVLLSGILQILNTWNTGYSLGYSTMETSEVTADDKLLFDIGLSTIFVVGTILAGLAATAVISREIENKTVLTIVSKPVSRVSLIIGKYLGVAGVTLISCVIMMVFLMMALRHGVMSTAADEVDMPVIVFGLGGVGVSLLVGAWCNYYYGWSFPQTSLLLMLPLMLAGWVGTLIFNEKWEVQGLLHDVKPQVLTACFSLVLAILVLSSVATAASTRLNQVLTIVVCVGVFLGALLSNYFVGRWVFRNEILGRVDSVSRVDPDRTFVEQSPVELKLRSPLPRSLPAGTPVYYSPSPNGFPLMNEEDYRPFDGSLENINDVMGPAAKGPAIVAVSGADQTIVLRNVGPRPVAVQRPPERGDYVFTRPTRVNYPLLAVWGSLPNLQHFWLLDAVSQNHPVPLEYSLLSVVYAIVLIVACLSLGVIMFQRRDVG